MARLVGVREDTDRPLPRWIGWWPATFLLVGWAWLELAFPTAARQRMMFVFSGQDIVRLASDPFGNGSDLFGTAGYSIDFQLVSPNAIWAVQVGAIVIGHVVALALARDRALRLSASHRAAVASQGPMLVLMVALTVLGLWSLSEGMARV